MTPCFLAVASAFYFILFHRITSGCRHKWTRQWHGTPNPDLTLSDLLHKALRLPELLTPDAQKASAATSRSFSDRFTAQVKVVTVTSEEDFALAIRRQWPVLAMVTLQHNKGCD